MIILSTDPAAMPGPCLLLGLIAIAAWIVLGKR